MSVCFLEITEEETDALQDCIDDTVDEVIPDVLTKTTMENVKKKKGGTYEITHTLYTHLHTCIKQRIITGRNSYAKAAETFAEVFATKQKDGLQEILHSSTLMLQSTIEKQMLQQRQWEAEMLRSQQQHNNELLHGFFNGLQILQASNFVRTPMSSSRMTFGETSTPVNNYSTPSNSYFQPIQVLSPSASPVSSSFLSATSQTSPLNVSISSSPSTSYSSSPSRVSMTFNQSPPTPTSQP